MTDADIEELARGKLFRVLGAAQGQRVFDETLKELGITALKTADDLYGFADALARRGGFEGAVGGLLSVTAVMRGAAGRH